MVGVTALRAAGLSSRSATEPRWTKDERASRPFRASIPDAGVCFASFAAFLQDVAPTLAADLLLRGFVRRFAPTPGAALSDAAS
jgi:hypothetical protein